MNASHEDGVLLIGEQHAKSDLATFDRLSRAKLLAPAVRRAIARGRQGLLSRQQPAGHWDDRSEGDASLEAQFVLAAYATGSQDDRRVPLAAARIKRLRLAEGGWSKCPGGSCDVNVSVLAYFALKLCGEEPGDPAMQQARRAICQNGGLEATEAETRLWLAVLGQISYEHVAGTTGLRLLMACRFSRRWRQRAGWRRAVELPMAVIAAQRPLRELPPAQGIGELLIADPQAWPRASTALLRDSRGTLAHRTIRCLRFLRPLARLWPALGRGWRRSVVARLRRLLVQDMHRAPAFGQGCTATLWSLVALRSLGCRDKDAAVARCRRRLARLVRQTETPAQAADEELAALQIEPATTTVRSTALALWALREGGLDAEHPRVAAAVAQLLQSEAPPVNASRESQAAGSSGPAGWPACAAEPQPPDAEHTALVIAALTRHFRAAGDATPDVPSLCMHRRDDADGPTPAKAAAPDRERAESTDADAAVGRAVDWLLDMQNADGGWSTFDKQPGRAIRGDRTPKDDAHRDLSSADVTGLALTALGLSKRHTGDRFVDRAVAWLRQTQRADGSWAGRWGVDCVHGTWRAVTGLTAVGVPPHDRAIAAAVNWLLAHQQQDGGWGELPPEVGRGLATVDQPTPTTATQTAWAILALVAAGSGSHPAVARGIQFLVDTQDEHGHWSDASFTSSAAPASSYFRHQGHSSCFPLLALSRWLATASASLSQLSVPPLRIAAEPEPIPAKPRLQAMV
jgi:squalene-hopene/tetraprenyl-beta-curcumene cyclase